MAGFYVKSALGLIVGLCQKYGSGFISNVPVLILLWSANTSQQLSRAYKQGRLYMAGNRKWEPMMICLIQAGRRILSVYTGYWGKKPLIHRLAENAVELLRRLPHTDLRAGFILQELTVEDGRIYLRDLMGRHTRNVHKLIQENLLPSTYTGFDKP